MDLGDFDKIMSSPLYSVFHLEDRNAYYAEHVQWIFSPLSLFDNDSFFLSSTPPLDDGLIMMVE